MTIEEKRKVVEMNNKLADLKDRVLKLQLRKKKFLEDIQARDDKQMDLPL